MLKRNSVLVINLMTGEEMVFMGCLPSQAVMRAWLMETGQNNAWDWPREYQKNYRKLAWGRKSVEMGNWCALTGTEKEEK